MIALAFDAARVKEAREGNRIRLKAVKRVRFKKPVRPDEPFTLTLTREQKENGLSYAFTILLGDQAVCTGILHVEPLADTM
jgi:3-hydroxymyristoyl/3-hydroxydecanoyl-(acyl carrier protein) dehydratase